MNRITRTPIRNTILRPLSLIGLTLLLALSVAAQDDPKLKTSDKELKYKSEDLKIKEKKEETKIKSDDLKIKDEKDERKVKATVTPMETTSKESVEITTGETHVRVKEHAKPMNSTPQVEPVVTGKAPEQIAIPATTVKKTVTRKYTAKKAVARKPVIGSKTRVAPKVIVRTKIVKDTVYVPSPPERIVTTQTEYIHDTVSMTRVDTVTKVVTQNTYSGYDVPKGDFKKVKLSKDKKTGEVYMKTKSKDGKQETEKIKQE
jgi:hypothetical protein